MQPSLHLLAEYCILSALRCAVACASLFSFRPTNLSSDRAAKKRVPGPGPPRSVAGRMLNADYGVAVDDDGGKGQKMVAGKTSSGATKERKKKKIWDEMNRSVTAC